LRASFSGIDAKTLLMPEPINKTSLIMNGGQYVGRVVPTHQPSLLVRVDEYANTTDVIMGSFKNVDWIMWQCYWGSSSTRTMESKIAVFMDMVAWLGQYNITLRGDFNNPKDWKAWHEAYFIMKDVAD
jgi:hypothetical protein